MSPLLLSLPLLLPALGEQPEAPRDFTLEQTVDWRSMPRLHGPLPAWRWAADGRHLRKGSGKETVWVDPRTWTESEPQPEAPREADAEREARRKDFAALEGVDEELADRLARLRGVEGAGGEARLVELGGALWFHRSGAGARRLLDTSPIELEELSPDARHLAWVQENDLYCLSTDSGEERRLTSGGSSERLNGKLDWVYQEEVYGRRNFKGFWWSPDSRYLAFLSLDETHTYDFTVIDHVLEDSFRVEPEITRYPKAGDPNPVVSLGLVEVESGETRWVELDRYVADEPLIVRVDWTPDAQRLLFVAQDRLQTWAELDSCDPQSGAWRTLIRESSDSWTPRPDAPRWLEDGSFLWFSSRSGYRHLYRYSASGELLATITGGEWEVRSIQAIDLESGWLWFTATKDGAVDSNLYRTRLDGGAPERLTSGRGRHATSFNADRALFLDTVSSLAEPPEIRLCDADGEVLRVLGKAERNEDYRVASWELVTIEARDGFPLDAALLKPEPFDASRSHPVWIDTYSGPDSPSVRNGWSNGVWHQFLAQNGLIVLRVNVRTASGHGMAVTGLCHGRLGVLELRDLEDAVDWLCANPWADASRVGISGHSYGGFMTAYALTHGDRFALGIAQSGVYDWGMYDSIYTERYMSTPQLNPEGYAQSSVIAAAENLRGHLLITHGVMDENVHVQNALQLAYALQKAGKEFEMMLYPQNRHGIADRDQRRHHRELEWRTIREQLLEEGRG